MERVRDTSRRVDLRRRPRRKVHRQRAVFTPADGQNAAASSKPNRAADSVLEQTVRGGEGCMATEIVLDGSLGKPAQSEVSIRQPRPNDKGRIRQVGLVRDRGHPLIRRGFVEHDHRCGIASKPPVGKRVNRPLPHLTHPSSLNHAAGGIARLPNCARRG